jgi:hypothetical protein
MSENTTATEALETVEEVEVLQAVTPEAQAAHDAEEAKAEAEAPKHVVKAGGDKGKKIFELLVAEPALTRAQLAEKAEATTGRVGEVIRWLAANGTDEEKAAIELHRTSQPVKEKKATPTKATEPVAEEKASTGSSTDKSDKPAKPRASRTRTPKVEA